MSSLMDVVIFLSTFCVGALLVKFWNGKRKINSRPYPPSVPSLPVVGSLPFMLGYDKMEYYFEKTAETLGPVFTFKLGNRLCLILTTREVIEEALVKHSASFSGRASFYLDTLANPNQKGLITRQFSQEFKQYHQLSMSVLKEFGFGVKSLMESRVLTELEAVISFVRAKNGQSFDPRELMAQFSSNVVINMVLGKRDDYDSGISEIARRLMDPSSQASFAIDIAPNVLRFIPYFRRKLNAFVGNMSAVTEILTGEIERIKADVGLECFVSRYLAKAGPACDQEQLVFTLRDLIGAGTETTAAVLLWLIVFAANHPVLQERLQRDIDEVIPRDRLPSIDDQSKLPLVEATILEVMRLRTIAPLAIPHQTLTDAEVSGYFIPKGTLVMPVIYGAHMNPITWIDPDVFRPERFLDGNNRVTERGKVIPFSLGRRSCPGEVLARQEIFLFLTGLLQQFNVFPPLNQKLIDDRATGEIVKRPAPFQIRFLPREKPV